MFIFFLIFNKNYKNCLGEYYEIFLECHVLNSTIYRSVFSNTWYFFGRLGNSPWKINFDTDTEKVEALHYVGTRSNDGVDAVLEAPITGDVTVGVLFLY